MVSSSSALWLDINTSVGIFSAVLVSSHTSLVSYISLLASSDCIFVLTANRVPSVLHRVMNIKFEAAEVIMSDKNDIGFYIYTKSPQMMNAGEVLFDHLKYLYSVFIND